MKKIFMSALGGLMMVGAVVNADSLYIDATGLVGVGTNTPDKAVHVLGATGGPEALYKLEQTDAKKVRFALRNPNGAWTFDMAADARSFGISKVGVGEILKITDSGQMFLMGSQIH